MDNTYLIFDETTGQYTKEVNYAKAVQLRDARLQKAIERLSLNYKIHMEYRLKDGIRTVLVAVDDNGNPIENPEMYFEQPVITGAVPVSEK